MWPMEKIRGTMQSIDQQLKENRNRVSALEQAAADQQLRTEVVLNQLRQEKAHLKDCWQNEQEKNNMLEAMLRDQTARMEELKKSLHQVKNELNLQVQEAQSSRQKIAAELEQVQSELTRQYDAALAWRKQAQSDTWFEKYGYDGLLANLQLAVAEQYAPGNRARLQAMRNTHQGESCFVVANGPSLTAEDLTVLHDHRVFSFGAKRINKIYTQTKWRPDVLAASDLNYIQKYFEEICAMQESPLLLPCQALINLNLPVLKNAIYYPFLQVGQRRDAWFNYDVEKGVHFWGTITVKMINFAVYMGFAKIYLLGVDNHYPLITDANGKTVLDSTQKTHFSNDYNTEEERRKLEEETENLVESFRYITKGFETAKYFCDQRRIEVYNATRGGELEVFPRVEFDSLF